MDDLTLQDVMLLLGERDVLIARLQKLVAKLEAELAALKGGA